MDENTFTNELVTLGMTYGKRLDKALEAADKTRKELACALACTPQSIGMVITGAGKSERFLSVQNHAEAARFLRVDSYWLATGKGTMKASANELQKALSLLSADAVEIATYFDMLKNADDRTRAYVASMAEILKVLAECEAKSADQPTDAPAPAENPEKRSV